MNIKSPSISQKLHLHYNWYPRAYLEDTWVGEAQHYPQILILGCFYQLFSHSALLFCVGCPLQRIVLGHPYSLSCLCNLLSKFLSVLFHFFPPFLLCFLDTIYNLCFFYFLLYPYYLLLGYSPRSLYLCAIFKGFPQIVQLLSSIIYFTLL